jgi:hypothetical protein
MPRANKDLTELRAAFETIAAQVAVIRNAMPVTILRVQQARQRTGLTSLLSPALDELDGMCQAVDAIGEQVTATLAELLEW